MSAPHDNLSHSVRRYFAHMSRRRRRQGLLVLALMVIGAIAETMTLGAVIPFLALVGDPQAAGRFPRLVEYFAWLGWDTDRGILIPVAAAFSIMAVAAGAIRMALSWLSQKFVFRLGYDLSVAVYARTLYQPYSFHVRQNTSEVIAGINNVQMVIAGMIMPIMLGMTATLISLCIFGALIAIDPAVALASGFGFGLVYVLVAMATRRRLRSNSETIASAQMQRVQTIQEGLGGIRDVLLDHAQPIYLDKFRRLDSALRDSQARNAFIASAPRFAIEAFGMVLIAVLALVLSGRAGGLVAALPVLGALALGAQRLLPLLQQIYNGWSHMMGSRQIFVDVLKLLEGGSQLEGAKLPRPAPLPFDRGIALEKVSFRYSPEGPLVLDTISLAIAKGSRIGFIGRTGSGKSTIMDLILGLIEPTEGHVLIDGKPLGTGNRAAWQARIAHVPQFIYLADTSIAENIAFGVAATDISIASVRAAAEQADLGEFVESLAEGYRTRVGERGIRLSGGQRQRVGIARALYKQATVLVFDEATSALDDETEAAVMRAIDGLGEDLTILTIAHRLSTVRNCDRIYRLSNGRVMATEKGKSVLPDRRPSRAASPKPMTPPMKLTRP